MKMCKKSNTGNDFMYEDSVIQSNVEAIEKMLNITSSDLTFNNMTSEKLKTAAEIFMYLNSCSLDLIPLINFFKDLLMNKSPDIILLTLNRFLKVRETSDNKNFKMVLQKIFNTTFDVFSKDYSKWKNMTWEQAGNLALNGGEHKIR